MIATFFWPRSNPQKNSLWPHGVDAPSTADVAVPVNVACALLPVAAKMLVGDVDTEPDVDDARAKLPYSTVLAHGGVDGSTQSASDVATGVVVV